MFVFVFLFFLSAFSFASESVLVRHFVDAAYWYSLGATQPWVLPAPTRAVLDVFKTVGISREQVAPYSTSKLIPPLVPEDRFDRWTALPEDHAGLNAQVALHAFRIKVTDSSDLWGDDLYGYFFVTDGVVPSGRVTEIYRGLRSGESFFLNEKDRVLFPVGVPGGRAPSQHLIVDYGIVESDGDDIRRLQQLTGIIVDLALAVYAAQKPQESSELMNLRREIKTLAHFLCSLNDDDRLIASSFGYKASEIDAILSTTSYVEFKRKHKQKSLLESWEYNVYFRLLRNN
jgi:hypothetical protein